MGLWDFLRFGLKNKSGKVGQQPNPVSFELRSESCKVGKQPPPPPGHMGLYDLVIFNSGRNAGM